MMKTKDKNGRKFELKITVKQFVILLVFLVAILYTIQVYFIYSDNGKTYGKEEEKKEKKPEEKKVKDEKKEENNSSKDENSSKLKFPVMPFVIVSSVVVILGIVMFLYFKRK